MRNQVFLDTNYAVALAAKGDQNHRRAQELSAEIARVGPRLITTQAVLFEIGNALRNPKMRPAAVELLTSLHADPSVEILPITSELYVSALKLFSERADKPWSLTDCASFEVMRQR